MLKSLMWGVPLVAVVAVACDASFAETSLTDRGAGGSSTGDSTANGAGGGLEDDMTTFVGQSCMADELCGTHPDSFCVTATDSESIFTSFWDGDLEGGGVAGGYCTRPCDADNPCPSGSRCGGDICLALCDFGAPDLPSFDASLDTSKCFGRDDLMCVPTSAEDSVCMPNCGAGSECGSRACDARYGVCTDPDRQGYLMGATCEVDNTNTEINEDPCAGLCLEILDDDDAVAATVCSARCSMGGASDDCGGPEFGVCAIPRVEEKAISALGDEGFCASSCEEHGQCAYGSGMFCLDLGHHQALGKGYCLRAESCTGNAPCGDGEVCVNTGGGEFCLDDDGNGQPLIALGDATP